MARGKRTDPSVVEQVAAALLAGMAVSEAADRWRIPEATVRGIRDKFAPVREGQGGHASRPMPSADRIGQRLAELIVENAEGMVGIARIAKDPEYLRTQQAGGLAQLYQAISDTTVRLLEAAEAAGYGEPEAGGGSAVA